MQRAIDPPAHRPAAMPTPGAPAQPQDEYEDLLGQWADLEAALAVLLAQPLQVQDFCAKLRQIDAWLQDLVAHDVDAGLYLMFQLASTSTVGYSAAHALVCAVLCHIFAHELPLSSSERDSLVAAALTMNIAMTALQNQLALQRERPSGAQQQAIAAHPQAGQALLAQLGVADALWLRVVGAHHGAPAPGKQPLAQLAPAARLARILATIDRYAAMISPRKSRPARKASDSARAIKEHSAGAADEVGETLIRSIGLCPPGTFVQLDDGATAIVLRRSEQPNLPLVASLCDPHGAAHPAPLLHQTAQGRPRIRSALTRPAREPDHRTMLRLGLYAAQHSPGLRSPIPQLEQVRPDWRG